MITVKPFGGLGNRMRVLHSVLSLQTVSNSQLRIIWEQSQNFNCSIYELFVVPNEIIVKERSLSLLYRIQRKILEKIKQTWFSKFTYRLVLHDHDIKRLVNSDYDFTNLLKYSSIYIETCEWFYTSSEGDFCYFDPHPQIMEQVQSIARNFDSHTVGIHIRRTDHTLSKKASPLSEFKNIMKMELDRNKNTTFYLSTDSQEVEEELTNEFKNHIITNSNKDLSRNKAKGIKDAFIDMLCLSETNKIYGSYHSTFSQIASYINNKELQVVSVLHNSVSGDIA